MPDTVILFEDEGFRPFLPLVYSRPVFDLRCGIFTARERATALLGRPPATICRPHLASVYGTGRWPLGLLSDHTPRTFVNGRALDLSWLPNLLSAPLDTDPALLAVLANCWRLVTLLGSTAHPRWDGSGGVIICSPL